MIKGLLTLIIGANTQPLDKALGRSGQKLKNFQKLAGGVTKVLGAFGGAFAIAAVVTDTARRIAQFDDAMVGLSAILRVSRDEIKNLEDQAISLGAATIFTSGQIGDLQTVLARFGFSNNEIEGATKGILDLAAATRTDLDQAATVTAGTLRSFNLEATESGRVADVITNAMTKSALTVDDFNQGMVYAAPLANQLGISLEETSAAMAILANNNIKGSIAGTSLRRIFTELGKQGYTLSDIFNEQSGALENVTDKLGFAKDATGQYALSSFLVLARNADLISEYTEKMGEMGSAQAVADQQLSSLSKQVVILNSAWSTLILSIENGEGVLGKAFSGLVKGATNVLNFLSQAAQEADQYDSTGAWFWGEHTELAKGIPILEDFTKAMYEATLEADRQLKAERDLKIAIDETTSSRKAALKFAQFGNDFDPLMGFIGSKYKPVVTKEETEDIFGPTYNDDELKDQDDWLKGQEKLKKLRQEQLAEAGDIAETYEVEVAYYREMADALGNVVMGLDTYIATRLKIKDINSEKVSSKDVQIGDDFLSYYDAPVPGEMFDPDRRNGPKIGLSPEEFDDLVKQNQDIADSYERMGNSIGRTLAQGSENWNDYANNLRSVVLDIVGMLIAESVASMVASAIKDVSAIPGGWLIAPAVGGLAAASAKAILGSAIPAFADGGIVSGPTLGLMGEYASASTNPEVIAPLSDLKGMLGGAGGDINVGGEFVLKDRVLVAAVRREEKRMNRYGA